MSQKYLDKLINTRKLSEILGVSSNTILNWRVIDKKNKNKPRIPFLKMGTQIRYKSSEVEKFIKSL